MEPLFEGLPFQDATLLARVDDCTVGSPYEGSPGLWMPDNSVSQFYPFTWSKNVARVLFERAERTRGPNSKQKHGWTWVGFQRQGSRQGQVDGNSWSRKLSRAAFSFSGPQRRGLVSLTTTPTYDHLVSYLGAFQLNPTQPFPYHGPLPPSPHPQGSV